MTARFLHDWLVSYEHPERGHPYQDLRTFHGGERVELATARLVDDRWHCTLPSGIAFTVPPSMVRISRMPVGCS